MRTAMRTVIFACLMALALADTTGTALPGYDYTFGSDVQGACARLTQTCMLPPPPPRS
jgi:hypothetical protein